MYRLLNTSPNVSSFLDIVPWMGEGQGLFEDIDTQYLQNRWNENYNIDFDLITNVYHKNWDMTKSVLCDKTPPMICRAKMLEKAFERFGDVHFVCMIRNPFYSEIPQPSEINFDMLHKHEVWQKFASWQKYNIENLNSTFFVTYEDLCLNTRVVVEKLLNKFPFLERLHPEILENESYVSNFVSNYSNERGKKITLIHQLRDEANEKQAFFAKDNRLLKYFGYYIPHELM